MRKNARLKIAQSGITIFTSKLMMCVHLKSQNIPEGGTNFFDNLPVIK